MIRENKIIIGADLVPTDTNEELFICGDAENLIGQDLLRLFSKATYRIFNLEVPLTDVSKPIEKCGPNLIAPTACIGGYCAIGVNVLTLANNHILDQSQQGLESTFNILQENGILFLGAGKTLEEACEPLILDFNNKKVGIYGCAEHEFSIVSAECAGANPFDPLESFDHVVDLKKKTDFVIVLYHGGKEHYRYPSPNLQKNCRKFVDKGADLVICQHSHCIGCEEIYREGKIVYGQGNFLFDHSKDEMWKTSLLIEVDSNFEISYIPLVKDLNKVRMAKGDIAVKIIEEFKERSEKIKLQGFINSEYSKFADEMIWNYLVNISGVKKGLCFRAINKLSKKRLSRFIVNAIYSKRKKILLRNYIECEAHRELCLEGLKRNNF